MANKNSYDMDNSMRNGSNSSNSKNSSNSSNSSRNMNSDNCGRNGSSRTLPKTAAETAARTAAERIAKTEIRRTAGTCSLPSFRTGREHVRGNPNTIRKEDMRRNLCFRTFP